VDVGALKKKSTLQKESQSHT